ncbi:DNA-directed RNA polymerase sigma-70 factor [Halobacillus andaensis]|uniref:DNA-directed RNA polymerase sigma-70 factor n=1 Tax=Halobacillus andaensis TaxID=1176239 RepID=A0A917B1H8_HALAA|nr:sigma-70 family RNA polymerase sigma factor [Halobacillus andaensis]MBP2003951.1 RNA polymerase sigma-70 factor (ECF subfamily) [Halobacillus andaensis]GGF14640.1 DNA-directed RNA polymerase sigma-70 factor [Halobacillus andaensis]
MNKPTDVELYERIQSRDKEALELLYDRYEKLLYSFAYRFTKDTQMAEEVMQDVFLKLWRGKGAGTYVRERGKFSSWLLTITRNGSIDLLRKKKVKEVEWHNRDSLHEDLPGVEKEIEDKEERDALRKAIHTLPDSQQRMICLFYFQGMSQREIAEKCDIPLGTVKGRVRLALKKLRENLEKEGGIDDERS